MFISPAYAQTGGAGGGFDFVALLPLVLIFVIFYFLLIRPQQKRMKEHRNMLAAIRRGDRIVTGGGIVGTVTKLVGDDEMIVEIADGVRVKVMRNTVANVLAKTEPVKGEKQERKTRGKKDTRAANDSDGGDAADVADDAAEQPETEEVGDQEKADTAESSPKSRGKSSGKLFSRK